MTTITTIATIAKCGGKHMGDDFVKETGPFMEKNMIYMTKTGINVIMMEAKLHYCSEKYYFDSSKKKECLIELSIKSDGFLKCITSI